jgi:hypothetical protein
MILRGPGPERDGVSAWTREDIAQVIEQWFGHRYLLARRRLRAYR